MLLLFKELMIYKKITNFYIPSMEYKRKYFKHIEWEELKIPIWK